MILMKPDSLKTINHVKFQHILISLALILTVFMLFFTLRCTVTVVLKSAYCA